MALAGGAAVEIPLIDESTENSVTICCCAFLVIVLQQISCLTILRRPYVSMSFGWLWGAETRFPSLNVAVRFLNMWDCYYGALQLVVAPRYTNM